MKRLLLAVAALVFTFSNVAAKSEKNVPVKVTSAFSAKFEKATNVKWDMENKKRMGSQFQIKRVELFRKL
ncbi:MAG: hypothetical protein PHS59_15250 [Paludibacter sp.]|nr:hypothetical protein [Paludibacter sp.]